MDLKEIAAVSGKPGLFTILKPTRSGVVLESLDEAKNKQVISSNTKVSILKDISVYTNTKEGNIPLGDIFISIHAIANGVLSINAKSTDKELKDFFGKVVPDYDAEKVYTSDIKKIFAWYQILLQYAPGLLVKQEQAEADSSTTEEKAVAAAPKKEKTESKAVKAKVAPKTNNTPKVTTAQRPKK